jgi:hypothetical protein
MVPHALEIYSRSDTNTSGGAGAYGLLHEINSGIQVRLMRPLDFGILGSQMGIDFVSERKDE